MAQGMRQGTSVRSPKIWGKDEEKEGAAWMETKCSLPTLSLSLKPKVPVRANERQRGRAREEVYRRGYPPLLWFVVMAREMVQTLW